MADELSREAKVIVVAPQGAVKSATQRMSIIEVPLRPLSRFLILATWKALYLSLDFRPNLVLAGSGLTAPLALIGARLAKATAIAYTHGLDLAVKNRIYRLLWLPAIRRLDCVITNSRATAILAENIGVPAHRIVIIHPGVEIPDIDVDECKHRRDAFRTEYALHEHPLLLSVGRLTTRKGLISFVRDVMPSIVRTNPDVCLLIVGDAPKDSLAAQIETPEEILSTARSAGIEKNVRWLGPRFGEALTNAYLAADVHVFPVRELSNDPEGFGMVAIEAAAYGLQTVAYAAGGVPDAVSEGISGRLVRPGDFEAFSQAVIESLACPLPEQGIRDFAKRFSWHIFNAKITEAIGKYGPLRP
jgi:phosphatidylinositol alpha-1,6-mannosyltransferase